MKQLGEATAKAARHRKFHWCRRPNGFSDLPIWRVVASKLSMPLYQVQAFGNRLEELANEAANFGDVRGSLASFNAAEFGMSLGMPEEEAARIFVSLEDAGWIKFDHVADFYSRNPDKEDETAPDRMRRMRTRDRVRKQLSRLAIQGKLDELQRRTIEATLMGISDQELFALETRLAKAQLSIELSTVDSVTRNARSVLEGSEKTMSTGDPVTRNSRLLRRNDVTVTPEQSTDVTRAAVDNCEDAAGAAAAGLAREGDRNLDQTFEATRWIDSEGARLLVEYLACRTQQATTYLERWRRDLQDDVALKAIMLGAEGAGYIGSRFHTLIVDGIKRHLANRQNGAQLPLPPRPIGGAVSAPTGKPQHHAGGPLLDALDKLGAGVKRAGSG